MSASHSSFGAALHADSPTPERGHKMSLYGFLVGDWEADVVIHPGAGAPRRASGEIHAGWVLEGRAIQDVWILPGLFYGTTLRVYDPSLEAWHILWTDPVMQVYPRMLGRADAAGIMQEGENETGGLIRWSFRDITAGSFHWRAEASADGAAWRLQLEFLARRVRAA